MGKALNIIFLGTSEFALPTLKALIESRHNLLAVVTKRDRPQGRGRRESPTAVMKYLIEKGVDIEVYQPQSLKDEQFIRNLEALNPQLFVVASFPIMPRKMVNIPTIGCLNIHPSLLPKYRGAAPIRWALLNGETITGVTTFFIGGKVDAGNIFLQKSLPIKPMENYGSLHNRLANLGAELAIKSVELISQGEVKTFPQDETQATPAPKITKEDLRIDWNQPAEKICNKIRAFSPQPGAYTIIDGRRFKVFAAQPNAFREYDSGKGAVEKDGIYVGCGDCCIELLEVQFEGKKRLKARDFLRGFKQESAVLEFQ